jgi:hypothetical protein
VCWPSFRLTRTIFKSELALRRAIEDTNSLCQLKRDFTQHMIDLYMGFREDRPIGAAIGRAFKLYANMLPAEQFAAMLAKCHIIGRRPLTRLRLALTKMLPMQTLLMLRTLQTLQIIRTAF